MIGGLFVLGAKQIIAHKIGKVDLQTLPADIAKKFMNEVTRARSLEVRLNGMCCSH